MPKADLKEVHELGYAGVLFIPLNTCVGYNNLRTIFIKRA